MKSGKITFKDIFVNRYVNQIIIPEIQRDYVWQKHNVNSLIEAIYSDFEQFSQNKEKAKIDFEVDEVFQEDLLSYYNKRKFASNIGFIYAYSEKQNPGEYFLIDGQQRLSTIFLLLCIVASNNEALKSKFSSDYFYLNFPKIDYRVRESAHEFLPKFINSILDSKSDVKNTNYYFEGLYDKDKTIQTFINNQQTITDFLDGHQYDSEKLYDFIENYVSFWYFDTNLSAQGEELYLYMNARGEQTQQYENLKAELLEKEENKNELGKEWEDWQDLFWKNRGKNKNADKGFNEFLSCITGLEYYLDNNLSNFYSKEKFEKTYKIENKHLIAKLSFEVIRKYIDVILYLEKNKALFKDQYSYSDWVDDAIKLFWSTFNENETNWLANYKDGNRGIERQKMVYVWSMFFYISKRLINGTANKNEVFRVLRIYYLRYHNYIRSVDSIKHQMNQLIHDHPFNTSRVKLEDETETKDSGITEEMVKQRYLQTFSSEIEKRKNEEVIWEIEDHKLNLNGANVGNTNITHLVDFNTKQNLEMLQLVINKFRLLFKNETSIYLLRNLLLTSQIKFWHVKGPANYLNLNFTPWNAIIRDIKVPDRPFYNIFQEFLNFEGDLKAFHDIKVMAIPKEECFSLNEKLLWYSLKVGKKIWNQGDFIAISKGIACSLPDFNRKDKIFEDDYIFYNTKGNMNGGSPQVLSELIPSS
jgi:hypothetical protein